MLSLPFLTYVRQAYETELTVPKRDMYPNELITFVGAYQTQKSSVDGALLLNFWNCHPSMKLCHPLPKAEDPLFAVGYRYSFSKNSHAEQEI